MTPQVRATEQAPVAAPRTHSKPASFNLLNMIKPVTEIKAPAADHTEDTGGKLLDKRRRRRARMSNRH